MTAAITAVRTTVTTTQVPRVRVLHLSQLMTKMMTMEVTVTAAKTVKKMQLIRRTIRAGAALTRVTGTPAPTTRKRPLLATVLLATVLLATLLGSAASCGEQASVVSTSQGAVWPPEGGSVTYTDPVQAAVGFATDFVGFIDPLVGEFQAGDARSGEVGIRATATGPITTVLLRQLEEDGSWSVLGAVTDSISPTAPEKDAILKSPVTLRGSSTAFEGTVDVAVRSVNNDKPLATGYVTGGSMGEMGPFESTLEFADSATDQGAVVFSTSSMEDGRLTEATVVAVRFR